MEIVPCSGKTEEFVDTRNSPKRLRGLVRTHCSVCPQIDRCRELSYQYANISGLWAGLSEKQRRQVRSFASHEGIAPETIKCLCEIGEVGQCYLHDFSRGTSK